LAEAKTVTILFTDSSARQSCRSAPATKDSPAMTEPHIQYARTEDGVNMAIHVSRSVSTPCPLATDD
jgi:hypothetical protein